MEINCDPVTFEKLVEPEDHLEDYFFRAEGPKLEIEVDVLDDSHIENIFILR